MRYLLNVFYIESKNQQTPCRVLNKALTFGEIYILCESPKAKISQWSLAVSLWVCPRYKIYHTKSVCDMKRNFKKTHLPVLFLQISFLGNIWVVVVTPHVRVWYIGNPRLFKRLSKETANNTNNVSINNKVF